MKKFVLTVTETDSDTINIETDCAGFNGAEIIGFLDMKKQDLLDQMCRRTNFKRVRKYEDGSEEVTYVEVNEQ